jgi:hypothetical protein
MSIRPTLQAVASASADGSDLTGSEGGSTRGEGLWAAAVVPMRSEHCRFMHHDELPLSGVLGNSKARGQRVAGALTPRPYFGYLSVVMKVDTRCN